MVLVVDALIMTCYETNLQLDVQWNFEQWYRNW